MENVHYKTVNRIFKYASKSFYRLNAVNSKFYEFSLIKENGKIDFEGGYYNGHEKRYFDHVIDLNTGKLVKEGVKNG